MEKLPGDREAIGQELGSAEPTKKPGVMGMEPVNCNKHLCDLQPDSLGVRKSQRLGATARPHSNC